MSIMSFIDWSFEYRSEFSMNSQNGKTVARLSLPGVFL